MHRDHYFAWLTDMRIEKAALLLGLALSLPVSADTVRLGVDVNGDGLIRTQPLDRAPVDQTTNQRPFIFWVNHDQDDLEERESWPITRPDGSTEIIDSLRDLEDFSRLRVEIPQLASLPASATVTLGWRAVDGAPNINVFRSADGACTRAFLLDDTIARRQREASYGTRLGVVAANQNLALSIEQLGAADLDGGGYCFLFDVAEPGRGELIVTVTAGNALLGESEPVHLWLRHVKTLYERTTIDWPANVGDPWEYRDEQPPAPELRWRPDPQGYEFDRPWYDTKDTIVWIYGWLRSGEGRYEQATTQSGETVFKRLWHRGYRGRLVLFHWPTVKPRLVRGFLRSEYRAFKCGPVLKDYVDVLPADRRIHVTAHSMGNVVLLEALKLGLEADNVLLQVAAIPAGAVDSREILTLPDMAAVQTPDTADEGGWRGYLTETRTRLYSMYSYSDRTFFGWNIAQKQMKPSAVGSARYVYRPEAEPEDRLILSYRETRDRWGERPVIDPHEAMAFIAQSKTHALGAEARVRGLIHEAFDLARAPYNFGPGHVAGWTRNPQQTTDFFNLFLDIFSIPYTSALL